MVYPKPGYRGIETFVIPRDCDLETGNLTADQFNDSEAVEKMLRRFYDRENVCDGTRLEPKDRSRCSAVTLRGMLFISCSSRVFVSNTYPSVGKIIDLVRDKVDSWTDDEHDSKRTMFVSFVGKPSITFGNKELPMPLGASLEAMYNHTAQAAQEGDFDGVHLGAGELIQQRVQARCVDWLLLDAACYDGCVYACR